MRRVLSALLTYYDLLINNDGMTVPICKFMLNFIEDALIMYHWRVHNFTIKRLI